jgi:N-acetylneuraminate synthase
MTADSDPSITIGDRAVGRGHSTYVIAEVSANHGGDLARAEAIMRTAADAGADAVKFQAYRPETMTLDVDSPGFRATDDGLWAGRTLYDLYEEAQTPWEWFPRFFALGAELGLHVFSSAFDATAVEFLEHFDPPAYKVASFELVDLELVGAMAQTGKPLIVSTGMATTGEIEEALTAARTAGAVEIALLRCNSAYPAPADEMDLCTIPDMIERWQVPVGLSDHTLGGTASIAAVALGASLLERHVTLSRADPTPDAAFSMEPPELRTLVEAVRTTERALGEVRYGPSATEASSLAYRRSLYVVDDVARGGVLDRNNVRAIRPGDGLPPRELAAVLGRRARRAIARGTPLSWELVDD